MWRTVVARAIAWMVGALLSLGCAPAASPCVGAACLELGGGPAPSAPSVEFAPDLEGGATWLNTDRALSLRELRGHVVVLDFWTYCCINCLHVLPELERVERRFADKPFQVIGVHSGKFDAEKDTARIQSAMQRHGVSHPVVVDSSFAIWNRFGATSWPTLIIIGPRGEIVARVAGEPTPGSLEKVVGLLLDKAVAEGTLAASKLALAEPAAGSTGPLSFPGKVAVSPEGAIAVADSSHHRIVLLSPEGAVTDVAGSGIAGSADGGLEAAAFRYPQGMAFVDDVLYVADTENHQIRVIDWRQRSVRTVAGTGVKGVERVGGPALGIALRSPWALAQRGRDLFVAMAGSHQLWKLSLDEGTLMPWAGSGAENIDDGSLAEATFSQPSGLALVGDVLYVADSEVSAIRAVDIRAGAVKTVVGTGLFDFGDEDGRGREAKLQHPLGLVSRGGVLFIADTFNNKLKRLDPASGDVTTVADGLAEPGGLAVLNDGRVLIADTNHHALKTYDPTSGALANFAITGLVPPASRGLVLVAPSAIGSNAPHVAVTARGHIGREGGTIVVVPQAPPGAKLTDNSPVVAEVDVAASRGLRFSQPLARAHALHGTARLSIPVETTGGAAHAVIETSFFWCTTGDEQACYPAHATLEVTVEVGSEARGEAQVLFQAAR